MSSHAKAPFNIDAWPGWAWGLVLTAAGFLVFVLPATARLRGSFAERETVRRTYDAKLSWVGNKDEIGRRLREQEAAAAALDARLLTTRDVAGVTQAVAAEAREAGCSVRAIRPLEPRALPRPDPRGAGGTPAAARKGAQDDFTEWPIRVELSGDYGQIQALLAGLWGHERYFRLLRLTLQPAIDNREQLNCDIEIAGYGLPPAAVEN